jgi:hypothetical protein
MTRVHKTQAYGCEITLEKIGDDRFHATVSYKSYNQLGEHIATPSPEIIGHPDEVYEFVLLTIADAQDHNKPIITIDLPLLNR